MIINKHGSFYLRSGWGTKIIQAISVDDMIFTPSNELKAVDNIGLGRVMIKALRYWANVLGLASEQKVQNGIKEEKTELFRLIEENDRYFQRQGTLLLMHRNLVLNKEEATAWYWAFNEFERQEYTKEDFVEGLNAYLAINGMAVKKNAIEKEYNCFKNTYISEKQITKRNATDEDTYPLLAPLQLLKSNNAKTISKSFLSKQDIPLKILIYCIAMDNREESLNGMQVSIDKILEGKCQVGKYFNLKHSKLLEMLIEAENKQLIALNNNFGNRHIEFLNISYEDLLVEYYTD